MHKEYPELVWKRKNVYRIEDPTSIFDTGKFRDFQSTLDGITINETVRSEPRPLWFAVSPFVSE